MLPACSGQIQQLLVDFAIIAAVDIKLKCLISLVGATGIEPVTPAV